MPETIIHHKFNLGDIVCYEATESIICQDCGSSIDERKVTKEGVVERIDLFSHAYGGRFLQNNNDQHTIEYFVSNEDGGATFAESDITLKSRGKQSNET